jgi:quercetin dioxygenase-like cupin family protein
MKPNDQRPVAGLAVALLLALFAQATWAQDPAVVNPKTVQVKLVNEQVRVLEAHLEPGDRELPHAHPACVIYVVAGGKVRNHAADGTATESELRAGDVVYRPALTHWAENIGDTSIHLILVELAPPQ